MLRLGYCLPPIKISGYAPGRKWTKLHTVAASNNRDHEFTLVATISKYAYFQLFASFTSIIRGHSPRSLHRDHSIIACSHHIYMARWVLYFTHILFVVNRTFNSRPTEMLQHHFFPVLLMSRKFDISCKLDISRNQSTFPSQLH